MAQKTTKSKKPRATDVVLVVIPYCAEKAQGRELEYAVAGWRRHFKEKFHIVIVGEDLAGKVPTGDDITVIDSQRVPKRDKMYRQHLDYVSCFRKVHTAFPDTDGFIFVADDCYAVNNFDIYDIKFLKMQTAEIGYADFPFDGSFAGDKRRTREALLRDGYPIRNFTTHLPQWFEWAKLEALWEKYDMENTSYIMEDLYYNIYYADRLPLQLMLLWDNFKCGIYRSNPNFDVIREAFKTKIWIQNSELGWSDKLDEMLCRYYFG